MSKLFSFGNPPNAKTSLPHYSPLLDWGSKYSGQIYQATELKLIKSDLIGKIGNLVLQGVQSVANWGDESTGIAYSLMDWVNSQRILFTLPRHIDEMVRHQVYHKISNFIREYEVVVEGPGISRVLSSEEMLDYFSAVSPKFTLVEHLGMIRWELEKIFYWDDPEYTLTPRISEEKMCEERTKIYKIDTLRFIPLCETLEQTLQIIVSKIN